MTTVSLVLGSGGARGYAHIGVIKALEERGYTINCIAGSSMGALIGGIYAADCLDDYTDWVKTLTRFKVLTLLDFTFRKGAINGDRLFSHIGEIIGDPNIEDLSLPFTAVAAELISKKEIWLQRGPLQFAIRASIAVPGMFTPVVYGKRVLVDGGVLNPLPIIPVVAYDSDLIIAVELNAPKPFEPISRLQSQEVLEKVTANTAYREQASSRFHKEKLDGNIRLIMGAIEVMQGALSKYKTAGYPPDIMISIPADTCRFQDFHRAEEVIEVGYQYATLALNDIEIR